AELLAAIEERHRALASELGIEVGPELERHFAELGQIAAGVALVGEVSDRIDARTLLTAEPRRGASARASILSATCSFAPEPELAERLCGLAPVLVTQ